MRQALTERLQRMGLTKSQAEQVMKAFAEETGRALLEKGSAKLPWLGKLILKYAPARMARNPRTGEPAAVPARRVVRWRPSRVLLNLLQEDA